MQKFDALSSETFVHPKELRELIARLSNPHQIHPGGGVTVRDIAETMDLKDEEVIQELTRLREHKKVRPVPQEAEKLAAVLEGMKTSDFKPITNRPLKRFTLISFILMAALIYGIFVAVANYLGHSPYTPLPNQTTGHSQDK